MYLKKVDTSGVSLTLFERVDISLFHLFNSGNGSFKSGNCYDFDAPSQSCFGDLDPYHGYGVLVLCHLPFWTIQIQQVMIYQTLRNAWKIVQGLTSL